MMFFRIFLPVFVCLVVMDFGFAECPPNCGASPMVWVKYFYEPPKECFSPYPARAGGYRYALSNWRHGLVSCTDDNLISWNVTRLVFSEFLV